MSKMNAQCDFDGSNHKKKLSIGIIITLLGTILLGYNLGVISYETKSFLISWQTAFIAIGTILIFGKKNILTGVILLTIGIFFIIPEILPVDFDFTRLFWPLIFIIIGFYLIFRHKKHKPITDNKNINSTTEEYANYIQNQDDLIEEIAIFSGIKHQILNKNLKGGTIVAIFGGAELDFSQAQLSDEPNKLEMVCVFGGASLIIPPDWNVQINVVSILGGFADKRHLPNTNSIENQKMLIIKGISIFGGGEIKTFPR